MKTAKFDLATAIFMLLVGGALAFGICSVLLPKLKDEEFLKLESAATGEVETPNKEIFNGQAINPTVEVCVGCVNGESEAPVEETETPAETETE
ncbi:MAG: hypothetical protein Q4A33_01910 [Candidatus Saccharibacteria bacterium]|nr:hypothetical protein [Candidatus Saccharibacteria bacterium]